MIDCCITKQYPALVATPAVKAADNGNNCSGRGVAQFVLFQTGVFQHHYTWKGMHVTRSWMAW